MQTYDPLIAPDPIVWLEMDEDERTTLVEAYHAKQRVQAPNPTCMWSRMSLSRTRLPRAMPCRYAKRHASLWLRAWIGTMRSTPLLLC